MILYKYYPCDQNTFKSLAVPGLWCHRAAVMNDPFECLSGVDLAYEEGELAEFRDYVNGDKALSANSRLRMLVSKRDHDLNQWLDEHRKKMIERSAFCSLSATPDNVLMWSHYASGHTGCVIGIEFPEEDNDQLQQVIYDEAPRKLDLKLFADMTAGSDDNGFVAQALAQFSVKGPMWKYEQEWRIWRNKPTYWKYKIENVKEVYLGVKCPIEIKVAIAKMLDGLEEGFLFNEMEMKFNPLRLEF